MALSHGTLPECCLSLTLTEASAVTMHECWYPADTVEVSLASAIKQAGKTIAIIAAAAAEAHIERRSEEFRWTLLLPAPPALPLEATMLAPACSKPLRLRPPRSEAW